MKYKARGRVPGTREEIEKIPSQSIVHRSDWYGNKVSEELRIFYIHTIPGGFVLGTPIPTKAT